MVDDIAPKPLQITTADHLTLRAEAILPAEPVAAAVICHPHTLMGGDSRNRVVAAVFRALPLAGIATLRFDFRGTPGSPGSFGGGVAERLDAAAALATLAELAPHVPLWSIGYSFGGDVALSVDSPALRGWIAIAAPLTSLAEDVPAAASGRLTLLLVPAHDQFRSPSEARDLTSAWHDTTVVDVPIADHSLTGSLSEVVATVRDAILPEPLPDERVETRDEREGS